MTAFVSKVDENDVGTTLGILSKCTIIAYGSTKYAICQSEIKISMLLTIKLKYCVKKIYAIFGTPWKEYSDDRLCATLKH